MERNREGNGVFAIRGIKLMEGPKELFVSMPNYLCKWIGESFIELLKD